VGRVNRCPGRGRHEGGEWRPAAHDIAADWLGDLPTCRQPPSPYRRTTHSANSSSVLDVDDELGHGLRSPTTPTAAESLRSFQRLRPLGIRALKLSFQPRPSSKVDRATGSRIGEHSEHRKHMYRHVDDGLADLW